jgi:hypothetical protein
MILFSEPTGTGYQWPPQYDLGWREWYEKQVAKMGRKKRG